MSDTFISDVVNKVAETPFSNNPNMTFSSVLNPMEIRILSIVGDEEVRKREFAAGNVDEETYQKLLLAAPIIREKIKKYNIAPIPYTLEEREPEYAERLNKYNNEYALEREEYSNKLRKRAANPTFRSSLLYTRPDMPRNLQAFAPPQEPIGFKRRQKIASYGIDPDNPYQFQDDETRKEFYKQLAFNPRNLSVGNVENVLKNLNIQGDLQYLNPSNPQEGFRFKPEGSDTYQILRDPRLTWDDVKQFGRQEGIPLAGDIIGNIVSGSFKKRLGSKTIPGALLNTLRAVVGTTTGTIAGDLGKLVYGKEQGFNDLDIDVMLKEAGVTGLYAAGGVFAVNTVMQVFPAVYRALAGTHVPAEVAEQIENALSRQIALAQKGRGDILYGQDVPSTEALNEQIKIMAQKFAQQFKEYNPTLSGGNPLDQDAADLLHIWVKNAGDPELDRIYADMLAGNQIVIQNVMRALGQEFELGKIPLGKEVDAAVREQAQQNIDRFVTEGTAAINRVIREMDEGVPVPKTTLFDNTVKGDAEILPKVTTNLSRIKDNYLLKYQENFNNLINDPRYAEFTTGAGFLKQIPADFKVIRNNTSRLFKRKEALKEIEETLGLGNSEKTLLYRLAGQSPDGKSVFKKPNFTIKELFELQTVLNEVRVNSKIPLSRKFAFDAIENINKQIDKSINDEVAKRLNIKVKSRYGKKDLDAINAYKKENNFGTDLTIAYKEMNQAYKDVDNQLFIELIKNESPERMIPAILNTNTKGAAINTRLSNFIKVLKTGGDDGLFYLQKEMIEHIRNNVMNPDNTPLQNNTAIRNFIKDNRGTLDAIYGDDFGKVFNKNSLDKIGKEIAEQDRIIKTLSNTFGVNIDSVNPIYDIANNIIRAGSDTRSTGQLLNDIDFLMQTVAGNKILEEQIEQVTKNIILRDVLKLKRGANGQFGIDPQALNKFLNEGLGPDELAGRLTFEETFGKLLGKNSKETIDLLKLLNELVLREQGLDMSPFIRGSVAGADQFKAFPGSKFIQRMVFPPLTQTGRRFTALDNLLNKRAHHFIGRMILDPKLAERSIGFIEGRVALQNYAQFLAGYGTVYMEDMGNELKYYDTEMKQLKINPKKGMDEDTERQVMEMIERYKERRKGQ